MSQNTVMIEISESDEKDFLRAITELELKAVRQSQSSALSGETVVLFSLAAVPGVLGIVEMLLKNWLENRKKITVKTPTEVAVGLSTDDQDHLYEVIVRRAKDHAD